MTFISEFVTTIIVDRQDLLEDADVGSLFYVDDQSQIDLYTPGVEETLSEKSSKEETSSDKNDLGPFSEGDVTLSSS